MENVASGDKLVLSPFKTGVEGPKDRYGRVEMEKSPSTLFFSVWEWAAFIILLLLCLDYTILRCSAAPFLATL